MLVENSHYHGYIEPLFNDALQIADTDKGGRFNFAYSRTSALFTNQNTAKTILLFKVKKEDLKSLFINRASLAKR